MLSTHGAIFSIAAFCAVTVLGCVTNPESTVFMQEVGDAVCARMKFCYSAEMAVAYPKTEDCVSVFTVAAQENVLVGCSQATADACYQELAAIECADLSPSDIRSAILKTSCREC